jgi:hypothetical protein
VSSRHLFVADYYKDGKYIVRLTYEKEEVNNIIDEANQGKDNQLYFANNKKEEKQIINNVFRKTNYYQMLSSNHVTYNVIDYINEHYRRGLSG